MQMKSPKAEQKAVILGVYRPFSGDQRSMFLSVEVQVLFIFLQSKLVPKALSSALFAASPISLFVLFQIFKSFVYGFNFELSYIC